MNKVKLFIVACFHEIFFLLIHSLHVAEKCSACLSCVLPLVRVSKGDVRDAEAIKKYLNHLFIAEIFSQIVIDFSA